MRFSKTALHYFRQLEFALHRAKLSLKQNGFSNSQEEQILAKYIAELFPREQFRTAVDIGAGDGIRWSNSYALFLKGWSGLGIEFDSRKFVKLAKAYRYFPSVFACRTRVTPENIIPLLE